MSVVPLNKLKYRQKRPYSCGGHAALLWIVTLTVKGRSLSVAHFTAIWGVHRVCTRFQQWGCFKVLKRRVMTIPAAKDERFSRSPGGVFDLLVWSEQNPTFNPKLRIFMPDVNKKKNKATN